jgi:hypothetical protein
MPVISARIVALSSITSTRLGRSVVRSSTDRSVGSSAPELEGR